MRRGLTMFAIFIALGWNSGCGAGFGGGNTTRVFATITNPVVSVPAGGTYTFNATTPNTNGYTAGITWSIVSPTMGGGTLSNVTNSGFSSSVLYTAPMMPPSPNSVTVLATPLDTSIDGAANAFSISAAAISMLSGHFAFELSGFDGASEAVNIAGSIVADGAGNITGGSLDFSRGRVPAALSGSLAGMYTLDSDMRGIISLTTAVPGESYPLVFAYTLAADRNTGVVTGSDANGFRISGTLHRQDGTAFSLAKISSGFAFKLESNSPSRVASVGKLTIKGNSTIVGLEDSSKTGAGPLLTAATVAGHVTAPPDANGRGTLTLATSAGASRFAYYVVSEISLVLIETESASAGSEGEIGVAERELALFSPATVNASSLLRAAGFDAQPSTSGAIGVTGRISIENFTHATLDWTSNAAGAVIPEISLRSELVTFDPASGRGTIKIANGYVNNFADSVVFYLASPGDGFVLDTTAGKFNRAISGNLEPAAASGPAGR
jgi:hypothetical protein